MIFAKGINSLRMVLTLFVELHYFFVLFSMWRKEDKRSYIAIYFMRPFIVGGNDPIILCGSKYTKGLVIRDTFVARDKCFRYTYFLSTSVPLLLSTYIYSLLVSIRNFYLFTPFSNLRYLWHEYTCSTSFKSHRSFISNGPFWQKRISGICKVGETGAKWNT